MRKTVAIILVLLLIFAYFEGFAISEVPDNASERHVYELPQAELTGVWVSGEWQYALRADDGYAVITKYTGHSTSIVIPAFLDGIDVVGIGSNAFEDSAIEEISIHGNILTIDENAFGELDMAILAKNGSYALYYAEKHDLPYVNTSQYTFTEGVIDYSDVTEGRIQRRGESFVLFNTLEGLRLSTDSIFWMKDVRGNEFFFRVLSLNPEGNGILAQVEVPEIRDAIVNMHAQYTIELTEDDFVPAEGVIIGKNAANSKTRTSFEEGNHSIPVSISATPAQMTKYIGGHTKETGSLDVSGRISSTISYTVEVINGELVYMDTEETSSVEVSIAFSRGKQLSTTHNPEDMRETDDPLSFSVPLGSFIVPTGWFNLEFSVAAQASITGSIDVSFTQETITKKVYNFHTEEWEMLKNNGNASQKKEKIALNAEIIGTVGFEFTMTFKMFFINLAQIEVEGGLKLNIAKTLLTADVNTVPCTAIEIGTYLDIKLNVGFWCKTSSTGNYNEQFGNGAGIKACVFQRSLDHEMLTGEKPFELHISLTYGFHWADDCPYGNRCCVSFDTKTGLLLEDVLVFKDNPIPNLSAYSLPDDKNGGKHLGWATAPSSKTADWVLGDETYPVTSDMTLYAVWENMVEVSFDSGDGSPVPSQFVPIGGYLVEPDAPVLENKAFVKWYVIADGDKHIWNFEEDTVSGSGLTLLAEWCNGISSDRPGTKAVTYIGDSSVDSWAYRLNEQTGVNYFKYSYVKGVNDEIIGVTLTGIKNYPVNLVIPSSIFIAEDAANGIFARDLPVLDISHNMFHGLTVTDHKNTAGVKSIRFELNSNPDISYLFAGEGYNPGYLSWPTLENLEFVDLSATSITEIGEYAFANCPSLKCVKLPAGIHTIGGRAFAECNSLENVKIPDGVETLGNNAFGYCVALKKVSLSNTMKLIPNGAFLGCSALEEVVIPEGITAIGIPNYGRETGAFARCSALKSISLPSSLTDIGVRTFVNCSALESVALPDGLVTIGNYAFSYCSELGEIQLPDSLATIGESAFSKCSKLKKFTLPENVTVGSNAFESCTAIEEIYVPNGLQVSSGTSPFYNCTGIQRITLGYAEPGVLSQLFRDVTSFPLTEVVISGTVTDIPEDSFGSFDILKKPEKSIKLILEEGIETIGEDAFLHKPGIKQVILPDSLVSIGERAFAYGALTSVSIPENVSIIGDNAFYKCASLKEVNLASSEIKIGDEAFRQCTALRRMNHTSGVTSIGSMAFSGCKSLIGLDDYSAVKVIYSQAFLGCSKLEDMQFSSNLTALGPLAFVGCDSLCRINLECTGITLLDAATFSNCTALEEVLLPYGLKYLHESAFSYCPSMKEIAIPGSIETIYNRRPWLGALINGTEEEEQASWHVEDTWMQGCTGLERIIFDGPASINMAVLDPGEDVPLKEISFRQWRKGSIGSGDTAGSLENTTAYTNENLSIRISVDGPRQILSYAFMGGTAITEVILSDSVSSIGEYAFANCSRLSFLLMDGSILPENIAKTAFKGCDELDVYIKGENPELREYLTNLGVTVLQPETYTLTLHANGAAFGDGSDVMQLQIPWYGDVYDYIWDAVEFSAFPESEIRDFDEYDVEWYLMDDESQALPYEMPRKNLEAIAKWNDDYFILDGNGGLIYIEQYDIESDECWYESYESVILPGDGYIHEGVEAAREGMYFKGWYYDPDCAIPYDGEVQRGDTIYAGWGAYSTSFDYTVRDGEAVLTKYFFIDDDDPCVHLPPSVDGYPLTSIAADAFNGQAIETLVLPDCISYIEEHAFRGMSNLKYLDEGYNPVYSSYDGMLIHYGEDDTCELVSCLPYASEDMYLPSSITHIADYAFEGSNISNLEIPSWTSLESIGDYAFVNTQIHGMWLPDTLTSIGTGAFQNCSNIQWMGFDADVEELGTAIFQGCDSLLMLYGPAEDCKIQQYADQNGHMYNCYPLRLFIGNNMKIHMVRAGDTLTLPLDPDMGENLWFTGWYKDSEFSEEWNSSDVMPCKGIALYAGSAKVFEYELLLEEEQSTVRLIQYAGSAQTIRIPETIAGNPVRHIGAGCFDADAATIIIPDCIVTIEEGALPTGAIVICDSGSAAEEYALDHEMTVQYSEYELSFDTDGGRVQASVALMKGELYALPVPVRSGYAFDGWYTENGKAAVLDKNGMFSMPVYPLCLTAHWTLIDESAAQIDFDYRQEEDRIVVTGPIGGKTTVRIPDELHGLPVSAIEPYAFMGDLAIEDLYLPASIPEIPANAFRNCGNLRKITLEEGITTLSENCFRGCRSLSEITLPEGIACIEAGAFMNCSLVDIHLPTSLVQLAADTFEGCAQLSYIGIDDNPYYESRDGVLFDVADNILVRYPPARNASQYEIVNTNAIGKWAFSGAKSLTSVHISDDVWEIEEGAFEGCGSLTEVTGMSNAYLTRIPKECFIGCSRLAHFDLPDGISSIGARAFANCASLKMIILSEKIVAIESGAFESPCVIQGYSGSAAETFAKEASLVFVESGSILPESITLSETELTVQRGTIFQLTATVRPSEASKCDVAWYSSDEETAYVDQSGLVHTLKSGAVQIYAVTSNQLSAVCKVNIDAKITELHLFSKRSVVEVGTHLEIEVCTTPTTASNPVLVWESSLPEVATVDPNGVVFGVAAGRANITARADNGISASIALQVISDEELTIIPSQNEGSAGDRWQLSVMQGSSIVPSEDIIWNSSNLDVIGVSSSGMIEFRSPGFATITAQIKNNDFVSAEVRFECLGSNIVSLPLQLTEIGEEAFCGINADVIVIPEGVQSIDCRAFANCPNLYKIIIPESVSSIDDTAFEGSEKVTLICDIDSYAYQYARDHGLER